MEDQAVVVEAVEEETAPVVEETTEYPQAASEEPAQDTPKTFTQEELDAVITKRLSREQRKWERDQAAHAAPAPTETSKISIDQFETPEAYAEALAVQRIAERDKQVLQSQVIEQYQDREEEARTKYDDFEQVAYNPAIRITDAMAQTIQASETGPDVAYYLGKNPKESERISKMPPLLQAREIGKIEARLTMQPPKKTSAAPAPIKPIGGKQGGTKSPADMSDDEYRRWRQTRSK